MAIAIREYLGYEGFEVQWDHQKADTPINVTESFQGDISPESIMVDIEGIHVGPTRNYTWYTEQALQGSVPTWTKPYLRPLIMHHNEKDGKIIGRIRFVTYTDKNTRSGTGTLLFTANVPDKDGKEQIQDGRLKTVSIGAIVHDCRCSICGQNIAEDGPCEHERGQKYDGKTCYWMIYSMEAKELSYVIVPSDIYAHNVRVYKPSKADMNMAANLDNKGVLNVSEATKIDPNTGLPITEGTVIDENGDKPAEGATEVPAVDNTAALQKEIDDLKQTVKDLEGKLKTLEDEKTGLLEDNVKAKDELSSTRVLLDQAQKSLETVRNSLTTKEAELAAQITLRESLEDKVIQLNAEAKNNVIENVIMLRKTLGKPVIAREELEKRSEDSLNDAIKDLKEELDNPLDVTKITPAVNPGIVENNDDQFTNVKEDKKAGNIDLAEGLQQVFSTIIGTHK